jgi:hypothetical protein
MAEPITFTKTSAERIGRVVRKVESGDLDQQGFSFKVIAPSAGRKIFRMAKFTSSWDKNSSQTVTFLNQTTTPNTALAINLFANVDIATSVTAHCAIARDGTSWYLIAAECGLESPPSEDEE